MWERGMPAASILDVLVRHHHHVDEEEREQHRAPQREDREVWLRSSAPRPQRIEHVDQRDVEDQDDELRCPGVEQFLASRQRRIGGKFGTSMRVVHQITASTHLARAAASTAS